VTVDYLINYINAGSMSSSSEATPDAIDHVGVIVYNRLYEFGTAGILKSVVIILSNCNQLMTHK